MQTSISRQGLRHLVACVALLSVLFLGSSCAASGPVITIEPSAASLEVNDTLPVSITVENIADFTAFEVHLSFDANTVEVVELKDGGFIKAEFIIQNTFDNHAGTIDYAVAQIDHPPASGSGTLFEIVFRAKAVGSSPIHFRETQAAPMGALFSDSDGMAIQVLLMDGSLKIPGS